MKEPEPPAARSAHRHIRPTADDRGRYIVKPEWNRSETVVNAGLIVVGVYVVQTLLATGVSDLAARISVMGWAAAIPLLAALGMLNVARESYRYASYPFYWNIARAFAQGAALVGLVAAFWHIWLPAAIVVTVSAAGGIILYAVYLRRLERDNSSP